MLSVGIEPTRLCLEGAALSVSESSIETCFGVAPNRGAFAAHLAHSSCTSWSKYGESNADLKVWKTRMLLLTGRHAPPRPAEVNSAGPHPTRYTLLALAGPPGVALELYEVQLAGRSTVRATVLAKRAARSAVNLVPKFWRLRCERRSDP